MVEVFKTNVHNRSQAEWLLVQIHKAFPYYRANFDLEDCDRILRVESPTGFVRVSVLLRQLRQLGVHAEVLPDEDPLIPSIFHPWLAVQPSIA